MQNKAKQKTVLTVSIVSASINTILALLKVIVGYYGYSQALIADGIHSFSDLLSDALVLIATRAGGRTPDKEHPYGHQRIETIATIIIAFILLLVAGFILHEAIQRILNYHLIKRPEIDVIVIAVISIFANEWLFRYTKNKGEKINSNLLISNAWHNRTDVFVSLIVLLSVIGSLSGLLWLDAVGAIIIALLILKMALKMIWQSVQELIDTGVDEETLKKIEATIISVPGVQSLHQLRTRLHANNIFVDCHIIVNPFISVSEGHHIGEQVHFKLIRKIKNLSDVTVHIDPENDEIYRPSIHLPNREAVNKQLRKRWSTLPGYEVIVRMTLHYVEGHLYIELFMSESVTKDITAADLLEQYQTAASDMPGLASVVIHYVPKTKG